MSMMAKGYMRRATAQLTPMKGIPVQQGLKWARKRFFFSGLLMRSHSGRYLSAFGPMAVSMSCQVMPLKSALKLKVARNCSLMDSARDSLEALVMEDGSSRGKGAVWLACMAWEVQVAWGCCLLLQFPENHLCKFRIVGPGVPNRLIALAHCARPGTQ